MTPPPMCRPSSRTLAGRELICPGSYDPLCVVRTFSCFPLAMRLSSLLFPTLGYVFFSALLLLRLSVASSQPQFYTQCTLHCPLQNRTGDNHFDIGCGPDCEISQCLTGCALWEKALEASCKAVCNGTEELLPPKELYCVMGCNDALNRYLQQLKEEYGPPPPPALVADSLTSSSLRLEWEASGYRNLSWLAQWRYELAHEQGPNSAAAASTSWEYAREQEWGPGPTVFLSRLTPYTKYRFRIVVLSQEAELISSEASLVIGTLPEGPPASAPVQLRATPTGPTRVSVTWAPGPFPNGPLLSYVLSIQELPNGYKAHKDIGASEGKHFYMFQSLLPSRNYSVSVAMRNAVGLGPAATASVTTPPLSQVKEREKTTLILTTRHAVLLQDAGMLDDPTELYSTSHHIRGVSYHVRKKTLFVSDSTGRVISMSREAGGGGEVRVLLEGGTGTLAPHCLSVDWLNDQLYILGQTGGGSTSGASRWEVTRCQLDGSGITVAIAGLVHKPLHIHVDPYNGYLFWLVQGAQGGGLYRLDLTDISNGIKHETSPDLILSDPNLGAFTVDYTNFRILVSSHEKNTVLAVSLDGREVTDIRMNTVRPMFKNVVSLTSDHGLFYWTNGLEVMTEEYHPGQDAFFHNIGDLRRGGGSYLSVGVDSPESQPIPLPANPPTCLQAVLGADHATATWAPPHLLGGQGKGAWADWEYRLWVEWDGGGVTLSGINSTSAGVPGLGPGQTLRLRVAALSPSGLGPWSGLFTGRTLQSSSPRLLWSASGGLLSSDPTGENLSTILHRHHLQDSSGRGQHVTDIAWLDEMLYLVTNSSTVIGYNTSSMLQERLAGLEAGSIAIDWIARRLYWSNPKQQLISRGHLNGSHAEPLPILTVAKELNIDALHAFIYWSTGHAVESARLNGKQRRTYYPAELFSGKQVMGLTLDMHLKYVYWIVRNYEGSTLFRAPMADGSSSAKEIIAEKMPLAQYPDIQGPLCYFDSRLLWLRDDRNAVIGDLNGTNSALLNSMSLTGLHMVTVLDPSLHPKPEVGDEIIAIPDMVPIDSLQIVGNHSHFMIIWKEVTNVNVGQIFYELRLSHEEKKEILVETREARWKWPEEEALPPYTELRVSIKAFTYWGSSPRASCLLHSPQSLPSQPLHPRAFVSLSSPLETEALLRWEAPSEENGVLTGYKILSWLDGSSSYLWVSPLLPASDTQYTTSDVPSNATVFFQVRACTTVGCGLPSPAVRVETGRQSPLPLLLESTPEGLFLGDIDRGTFRLLSPGQDILAMDYLEEQVYWLDGRGLISVLTPRGKAKVVSLNQTGLSLAVDWIGRFLFWSEKGERQGSSIIKQLDLTLLDHGVTAIRTLAHRPNLVLHLQADPRHRQIYWVEEKPNKFTYLMRCRTDDCGEPQYFFEQKSDIEGCNCPESPLPWPKFSLDRVLPRLYWIDAATGSLLQADLSACRCQLILDNYSGRASGLPPSSLTLDLGQIYWSNGTENKLYQIPKAKFQHTERVTSREVAGLERIQAFGRHLQPLPDLDCLVPSVESRPEPVLISKSSHTLRLDLGQLTPLPHCSNISQSSSVFTLYYGIVGSDGLSPCALHLNRCLALDAFDSVVDMKGLLPYTTYVVRTLERNHYLDRAGLTPRLRLPYLFHTAPGAPSPPEAVYGSPLSPTVAEIQWNPPKQLNSGRIVRYEVVWRSEDLADGVRHNGEQIVTTPGSSHNSTVSVRLHKLIPGQSYRILVRAYSENSDTYSESDPISLSMFSEPPDIYLENATPYSLNISWPLELNTTIVSHEMEYMIVGTSDTWLSVPLLAIDEDIEYYFLDNLRPKTSYAFRLRLVYTDPDEEFLWPTDNRFTFRTLGDRPSRPGRPVMQHLSTGAYQMAWAPSLENGAPLECYSLEGRPQQSDNPRINATLTSDLELWDVVYNGTDNYWKMPEDFQGEKHRFRVRGLNSYGWSAYSEVSVFDLSQTVGTRLADSHNVTVVLWVLTPTAIIITILLFVCVLYRTRGSNPKKVLTRTDTELATLRELPRWSVQNTNLLYAGTAAAAAAAITSRHPLPRLRRDQITLTKFLGSGAFGEVFEGHALALNGSDSPTRVAIKTLRKGANGQEKAEFLKEAGLMSNFKHPHILQLLGVCLDNDPHFIIMELMEGGDLLSYLRANRPNMKSWDLLSMCVDVARGCCYLEEMHFVHRDLACRNCLVSSNDPATRIVKIGDFGLARDIYKNDYYRKEGEGLLPVRWMAPESLVDGVFTSQSDVWAFGVLLWEIQSLGQQPYPARNNLEVLNYVRGGGRLSKPLAASSDMYALMTKCWSFNPDERPTFKYCLDVLVELKSRIPDIITPPSPQTDLIETSESGCPPKYLELVYEGGEVEGGGYEIPRCLDQQPLPLPTAAASEEDKCSLDKLLPPLGYANMTLPPPQPTPQPVR